MVPLPFHLAYLVAWATASALHHHAVSLALDRKSSSQLDPQTDPRTHFLFSSVFCRTAWFVFGNGFHSVVKNYPFEYLCFPFLIWAAFRFGRRKAATAICDPRHRRDLGHGSRITAPSCATSQNTSLLLLQSFMAIVAVTTMVLAAESTRTQAR